LQNKVVPKQPPERERERERGREREIESHVEIQPMELERYQLRPKVQTPKRSDSREKERRQAARAQKQQRRAEIQKEKILSRRRPNQVHSQEMPRVAHTPRDQARELQGEGATAKIRNQCLYGIIAKFLPPSRQARP
jgi:hypothetical protein